jgi:hypothetical protein
MRTSPGFTFRVSGFGFWVSGSRFRVLGFGFKTSTEFTFRVSGFGFEKSAWCQSWCPARLKPPVEILSSSLGRIPSSSPGISPKVAGFLPTMQDYWVHVAIFFTTHRFPLQKRCAPRQKSRVGASQSKSGTSADFR